MMTDRSDYTGQWDNLKDRKRLVRASYDAIAANYLASRVAPANGTLIGETADVRLLDELTQRLAPGALVLDAGCGAGVPIARLLLQRHRVVGVDFSRAQLALARRLAPEATYICQDLTALAFAGNTFDAVCSYYAIIHIPREEHEPLLRRFHQVLKPGGLALLCLGANDLPTDYENDYFGKPMYWSHFDAQTNLNILKASGLELLWSRLVPDSHGPDSAHLFVLARKPSSIVR